MRIGLLRCDEIFVDLRPRYGGYHRLFTNLFAAAGDDVSLVDVPVCEGTFPDGPNDHDAWLITGSIRGVYEKEPWIHRLLELIRELDAARAPTVGVCFGHQAIAQALGGRVEKVETYGLGNRPIRLAVHETWMDPARDEVGVFYSHHDQVVEMPVGGRVLGSSDHCPVAALAVGEHLLGIQAHPEFDASFADGLYRGRLTSPSVAGVLDDALATLDAPLHRIDVARWMLRFLRGPVPLGPD